jgi:hypothetical protein
MMGAMAEHSDPRTRAGEKLVTITAASRTGEITTVALDLESDHWPGAPVAPATLWTDDNKRVIDLHKAISVDDNSAVVESYDLREDPPQHGGPFSMIGWWMPEHYEAATDASTEWRRATFERSGTGTTNTAC